MSKIEPVAYRTGNKRCFTSKEAADIQGSGRGPVEPLYTADALREVERRTIERCAKVCEPHADDDALDRQAKAECAAAIRALPSEVE